MAEREFSVTALCFTGTVVLYAPGQLSGDLLPRLLEDLRQLFKCPLQNPPVCFVGRVTLVKDSFRGLDSRYQHGPLVQPDSPGQILEKKKSILLLLSSLPLSLFFKKLLLSSSSELWHYLFQLWKASLTGHHILITPNIIITIALVSRQGLIMSSDSIGGPSAGWRTIGPFRKSCTIRGKLDKSADKVEWNWKAAYLHQIRTRGCWDFGSLHLQVEKMHLKSTFQEVGSPQMYAQKSVIKLMTVLLQFDDKSTCQWGNQSHTHH